MRVFLCECTCTYLCDSVFSWLPDTLKPMYVCDLFLPRMDVFCFVFSFKVNCMYPFEFFLSDS